MQSYPVVDVEGRKEEKQRIVKKRTRKNRKGGKMGRAEEARRKGRKIGREQKRMEGVEEGKKWRIEG